MLSAFPGLGFTVAQPEALDVKTGCLSTAPPTGKLFLLYSPAPKPQTSREKSLLLQTAKVAQLPHPTSHTRKSALNGKKRHKPGNSEAATDGKPP